MVLTLTTDALNGLCSYDQLELLDAVDRLRLQGIDHYISLPQIIVCGDQSSGKSSVLEAISGVPFPVKSNLCTRFPTELVLRRAEQTSVTVSIVPHKTLGRSEKKRIDGFNKKLDGFEGLPSLVETAKIAMGISTNGKAFSKDRLRIEITGPDRPHLTIVDLPGLIHSKTKQQTKDDIALIHDVVKTYMTQPRSIILAVVSAKSDIGVQLVLDLAQAADPDGKRTIGVITKPDTLVEGSESEAEYIDLASNKNVELDLGWHVLRNLDSEVAASLHLHTRNALEASFFSKGVWEKLPPSMLGIGQLRIRLSDILLDQIKTELPSLIEEIDAKFKSCQQQLQQLGSPRITPEEQQHHLLQISQEFYCLVKASVEGTYTDPFFENATSDKGYYQRIRAVIQNLNEAFAEELVKSGHLRAVSGLHDETTEAESEKWQAKPQMVDRSFFIEHIENVIRRTRGRELPGIYSPMVVADLFVEQSQPWTSIAENHVLEVWKAAKRFLWIVLSSVSDEVTAKVLIPQVCEPALDRILSTLNNKTKELLNLQHSRTITYNDNFVVAVDRVRRNGYFETVRKFFNCRTADMAAHYTSGDTYNLTTLVDNLAKCNGNDSSPLRAAASRSLDCMIAYYDVAIRRFIDDMTTQVVEAELISVLSDILSPISVSKMSPQSVALIVGESAESRAMRKKLKQQLDVLEKGSETCKRFADTSDGTGSEDTDEVEEEELAS